MSDRKRSSAGIAVAAISLGLLAGCGGKEPPPAEEVVRPVKTMVVGGMVSGTFTFPGIVEAGEKAALSFRVSGRLERLPIDEGQEVRAGQLIAQLEPRDFQIAVEEARAEFTKAEADYARYQRLFENDAVPLADLELRRSQRDVAKARLDDAEQNLSYTKLTAPFDGRIGRRYVENHMDVQANQEIVDLNDIRNVEVVFDLAENLAQQIRRQGAADVFAIFEGAPGVEFPLTFKEASNRADAATQTFEVTFIMPQPEELQLLPGMTVQVKAVLSATDEEIESSRVTLPAVAVLGATDGSPFVWVVDPDAMTAEKRMVRVGPLTGSSNVVVNDGLEGGDHVVVAGGLKLREGMKVRFWEKE